MVTLGVNMIVVFIIEAQSWFFCIFIFVCW